MEITTTVDVYPSDILEVWKVKDILEYTAKERQDDFTDDDVLELLNIIQGHTDIDIGLAAIDQLEPWDILYHIAKPLLPRNVNDRQSIKDAIIEYLSRL